MANRQTLLSVIALLFIFSGATALMYQIVWFKYLSLFLGNTTYAQTVVLATFMGGLAIGAAWLGKRADRTRNPLALYGWLEVGIGLYCLAYPSFLGVVREGFIQLVTGVGWPSDSSVVLLLKLVVSLTTMLIPTMLMGGTLPVLVRFISERIEDTGKNVATLYFLNSFGAVIGSFLGGLFFIPNVGLLITIYAAVAVNLIIGVVALLLSRRVREEPLTVSESSEPAESEFTTRQAFIAVGVAGLSGFAAMVYEICWVRLLLPIVGSSTYSFSLMLIAFITGITLGSWIVGRLFARLKNLFGFLAVCQLGVAVSLALTIPLYDRLPYYLWSIGSVLSRTEGAYPIFLALQFLLCLAIMVVPTVFLGMTLPVASRIASRRIELLGTSVGNVFSVNTVGAVLGSLGAGLMFIPLIGVRHTLELALVLNALVGLVVLAVDAGYSSRRKTAARVVLAGVALFYVVGAAGGNPAVGLMSVYRQIARSTAPPPSFSEFVRVAAEKRILFYKEGASATVAVAELGPASSPTRSLYINGKVDASNRPDLPTQVLPGQYPMLFHPNPSRALVIGLGSGVTIGSLLTHPVASVECVEISPEVVEASRYFDDVNGRPLDDPRVRVFIDDALAFLKLSKTPYDVIVSEPSNAWVAGVGNLFSREFFELCKRRLTPGGLMVQWFHVYEMDDRTLQLVVRTFRESFPSLLVWQSITRDIILFGSQQPLALDYDALKRKFEVEAVREDLARIGIHDALTLLSLQMLSEERVEEYAGVGLVNTEDLPILEFRAPKDLFLNRRPHELFRLDERESFGGSTIYFKKIVEQRGLTDQERLNIGMLHSQPERGLVSLSHAMLKEYSQRQPENAAVLR
ncbi:MAG: fused MFS/spermidine synthase, partial [Bacteroidota bacterium]